MFVSSRDEGAIRVIAMENPPANALNQELRAGLVAALASLRPGTRAVVLHGTPHAFSAGVDIAELATPPCAPGLRDVIAAIEASAVPVIAAIAGEALGGGLELALACHARLCWPGARMGLPEVRLGLLPGAGGTQRLPRLVGVAKALGMILSGDPVGADEARATGLVTAVLDGPFPEAAIAWARANDVALPPVRDGVEALQPAREDAGLVDRIAAPLLKGAGGPAPAACVQAVRDAVTRPFADGLAAERAAFERLLASNESRALRHAALAERAARKPDLPPGTMARPVASAAVIGAGTMGGGIAMAFANAGVPVRVVETTEDALERGMARVRDLYAGSARRGSITPAEADARLARISGQVGFEGLDAADIVIEAVFEELGVKQEVFRTLDRVARPGAVLATNTSYLDIDAIAGATSRPSDVVGMHFFSPANVMRLLEIVRGRQSAPEAIATAAAIGERLGKVPVVVGNCFGFVGNRMLSRRTEAAERLLLQGAEPAQVDAALTGFGFRMGPFAMADLAGLDVGWRVRKAFGSKGCPVADALCEAGHFGQKTGVGFYRYEGRAASPNPEVGALAARLAAERGVTRQALGREAILERLIFPMINEGARILDEGIAGRPGDIDTIWIAGYNWPSWRGGPMYYADQIGIGRVQAGLRQMADESGDAGLRPAPLLERLAAAGQGFYEGRSKAA